MEARTLPVRSRVVLYRLLVAFAALVLTGQAPTMTFESPGITVKGFCAELSRQTGRNYVVRDEIQTDLLAIRVTNVPLDDLLKKVQLVERAKLLFDGKTYTLRPDGAVRAQLKAERFALRIKAAKEAQAYMSQFRRAKQLDDEEAKSLARKLSALEAREKELDESATPNASVGVWVQKEDESLRLPIEQALLKMFLSIPAEDLAAIDSNGDAVWSTGPTPMEHALTFDSADLLGGIARDESVWHEAAANYLSSDATKYFSRRRPDEGSYGQIALLRLSCSGSRSGGFVLELTGFDRTGKKLLESVKSSRRQSYADELAAEPHAPDATKLELDTVALNPANAKLIRLWSAYPKEDEIRKWTADKEFLDLYFNPDRFDPASETFGRALLELAKARGKQLLVAESGADASELPEGCIFKGKLNLSEVEDSLSTNRDIGFLPSEYSSDAIWITLRPRDLDDAVADDFSRSALGTFLRTARDKGVIGLMDVARFAADKPDSFGPRSNRGLYALQPLLPSVAGLNLLRAGTWPLKCLLGRLDPNQIAVAQMPDGLSLASCTSGQLECAWNALRFAQLSYHGQTNVWRSYPTDGLPRGVPGGGVLHLSTEAGPSLRARIQHPGDWVEDQYLSPDELAARLARLRRGSPDSFPLVGVRPAKRISYVFRFVFPDDTTTSDELDDDSTTGPEVKSVDELPEPLRSQVKTAMQKAGL